MNRLLILLLLFSITLSADRGLQKIALVIGNNDYSNLSILKNPISVAKDIIVKGLIYV